MDREREGRDDSRALEAGDGAFPGDVQRLAPAGERFARAVGAAVVGAGLFPNRASRGGLRLTPEYWKRVTELFEAAAEHEPAEWADFVARATGGDPALAEEVLRLLASDEKAGAFLSRPPGLLSSDVAAETSDHFAGRTLSRYRLEEPLGAGGMGLLYRATDLTLGRSVAVKLLARHLVTNEFAGALRRS